jgi:predicted peptidase
MLNPPKLFLVALLATLNLAQVQAEESIAKGEVQKRTYEFKEASQEMEYCLYVPRSYETNKRAPLIVLLHGLGSNPRDVIKYAGITSEAEEHGYIVVAPYGYNSRGWYGSQGEGRGFIRPNPADPDNLGELSEKDVLNVLGIIQEEFNIDENRIYLMGHSMGGGGTIHIGTTYPEIWAGLAPLAPAIMSGRDKADVLKKHNIAVMLVTGDKDRLIPVAGIRRYIETLKAEGVTHIYKEIKDGNHGQSIAMNPEMIGEVFDFFNQHSKSSKPGSADDASSDEGFREFSNKTGKKITARILSVAGNKVTIIREGGGQFTIPITALSEEDEVFISDWKKANPDKVQ